VRAALLLLALLPAVHVQACPPESVRPIASLRDLPKDVLSLLGRFEKPQPVIADIGEPFNASDVLYLDSPPQRRLVSGVASKDCVALKVEFGGFAHYMEQVEFQDTWRGWVKTRGGYDTPAIRPAPTQAPRP
jgi:hypothetical protein